MSDTAMPADMVAWIRQEGWGNHHLEWHLVRIWDLVAQATRDWATAQGWSRSAVQEGEAGNGLAFLAMHRIMVRRLVQEFPQHSQLFDGWAAPPQDPNSLEDPLPNGATTPFNSDMAQASDRLTNNVDSYASDDEIGLYIETSLRPLPGDPDNRASDASSGIHNYLHGRWSDDSSDIDLGDPTVNIENTRFWKLHGWIETVWTNFRIAKGLPEDDPEYVAALAEAAQHMGGGSPPPVAIHAAAAADGGHHHHDPTPIDIPSHIKEDILRTFYFCDIK